jgi:hypothetical protein
MLIAYHEAGHAVTAEAVAPGSVWGIEMDGEFDEFANKVHSMPTEASTRFGPVTDPQLGVLVYGAFAAEDILAAELINPIYPTRDGDLALIEWAGFSEFLKSACQHTAYQIVDEQADAVERLASALLYERRLDGDRIREIIAAPKTPDSGANGHA